MGILFALPLLCLARFTAGFFEGELNVFLSLLCAAAGLTGCGSCCGAARGAERILFIVCGSKKILRGTAEARLRAGGLVCLDRMSAAPAHSQTQQQQP
mmetsp:Transcript_1750/g.3444  ORF Transcript_1750/g.3444 Transcript_1750/m.3444 type:complete len:98 (-) Transcript_1750:315-608(-)